MYSFILMAFSVLGHNFSLRIMTETGEKTPLIHGPEFNAVTHHVSFA